MLTPGPGTLERAIKDSGVPHRQSAGSWIFHCPRCRKKDMLYIRKRDGRFICWVCATTTGFRGAPEFALRELTGLPIYRLRESLYGVAEIPGFAIEMPEATWDFFDGEERPINIPVLRPVTFPHDFYPLDHPHAAKGRAYLEGRGVDLVLGMRFGLRYHPVERRVIFPVVVSGMLLGWQARSIEPTVRQKILTEGGFPRDRVLMFQDLLLGAKQAILCEGPVDAIKCWLCCPAVAAMGKSVSREQIQVLLDSGIRRIYLGLDPDAAAECGRLCKQFAGLEVYRLLPPPETLTPGQKATDLGGMTPAGVLQRFQSAPRITEASLFCRPIADVYPRYTDAD